MAAVTSAVAACLDVFGVAKDRYDDFEEGSISLLPNLVPPNDAELVQLLVGKGSSWSQGRLHTEVTREVDVGALHALDFVCLAPQEDSNGLYEIAQVQSVTMEEGRWMAVLTGLKRCASTERALKVDSSFVLTDPARIKRNCWVASDGSLDADFTCKDRLEHCRECLSTRLRCKEAKSHLRRIRTLSLFGGAGGMDVGLSFAHFRTNWMVDMSQSACETFQAHHPSAAVIQMDAGEALRKRASLPSMPRPGTVDAIVMGPPCQPFSKINRQSKKERQDDPRSLAVATGLSLVEVYRPSYGVIENVCGMLENGSLGNVKKNGIVKFILLCLSTLGYNARMGVVECGGFGIPQARRRLAFAFARQGLCLPELPMPTYRFKNGLGLHAGITIADATSDLPPWDLRNPRLFCPPHHWPVETRSEVPPSLAIDAEARVVGPRRCRYMSAPQNAFQHQMRLTNSPNVEQHHIVPPLPLLAVEQIWSVPTHPRANHLALQNIPVLAMPELVNATDQCVFQNAFGRLDAKGQFPIITTSIKLKSKSGRMIMPTEHRVPSIRELARAQGFPDGICFSGSPQEMLVQIGNAVPVPLAAALGASITASAVADFLNGNTHLDRRVQRSSRE